MAYRIKKMTSSYQLRGFTLIELMIAVAIIGILASIAYPSYQSSVRKNHRASAQSYLLDVAQREQLFFTDKRKYTSAVADLGSSIPAEVSAFYTIKIEVGSTPPAFIITATAKGVQLPDGDLTLSNTGVKTPSRYW